MVVCGMSATSDPLTGFLCYARADADLVDRFVALMRERLTSLRGVGLDAWWDRAIVVGTPWDESIRAAIRESRFGIVCVTPALFASPYIREVELPGLMGEGRIVCPVGIRRVLIDLADMRGLEHLQIFTERPRGARDSKWFAETRGVQRERFCDELVRQIVARLNGELPPCL